MNIAEMRRVMDALGPDLDTMIQMKGPERELALIGAHAILHAFRPRILAMLDVIEAAGVLQQQSFRTGDIEALAAWDALATARGKLDSIP